VCHMRRDTHTCTYTEMLPPIVTPRLEGGRERARARTRERSLNPFYLSTREVGKHKRESARARATERERETERQRERERERAAHLGGRVWMISHLLGFLQQ